MKEESSEGTFRVEAGIRPARTTDEISEQPFHVALLGDFSGSSAMASMSDSSDVSRRVPIQIDRDDVDAVIGRVKPSITISSAESAERVELSFVKLEDFHPDQLIERDDLFGTLKAQRAEIADPAGFADFKEQLKNETQEPSDQHADDPSPPLADGNLLDQILDESSTQVASTALADGGLQDFVKRAVAPHEVPRADPTQAEMLAQFDERIASRMRSVMHDDRFQNIEALWRGVSFLCRRVETSPTLKMFIIDVSKEELLRDQDSEVPLENTGLYRLLVESTVGTPGAIPWALLVGCYSFGPGMDDLKLLARLGAIAKLANAAWLSAADGEIVGCSSFANSPDPNEWEEVDHEGWNAIRLLPYASRVGLALPRFLLRLPYGSETDECDQIAFEEISGGEHDHEDYLWGNPALLCALLIIQSYAIRGPAGWLAGNLEVDKLPLHIRKTAGETVAQPCAEALLGERALTQIGSQGLMVLASLKDRDVVRLLRFQSVSDPPTSLEGPWT